jgi:hypothetical protein
MKFFTGSRGELWEYQPGQASTRIDNIEEAL